MPLSRQGRERLDRLYSLCESNRGRLEPRRTPLAGAFRIEPRPRSFAVPQPFSYRKLGMVTGALLVLLALVGLANQLGSRAPAQTNLVSTILPAVDSMPIASGAGGNSSVTGDVGSPAPSGLTPAPEGVVPAAAPASVTGSPPIGSHQVFGTVPYWALADSAGVDLSGLTTVDYFAVGINPDGSLNTSSAGALGYQSQNFVDLVDRAHAAGERVVVTLDDFSQSSLDQLAASATAPQTLADSVLFLVKARDLDGVNLDLEGQGSGDQSAITNLVKVVSQTLKAANPDYQLTMDTYASSAGDADGFFDIGALNPYVDGFFVMAYQLNLRAAPSGQSVLTSSMFSNQTALNQYTNAIPPSKVLLGMPSFGYDWPTTNGTLDAEPAGGPTIVTYAEEARSGHPIYWDPVTDTAWTSYEVGSQWHEAFFENPTSLSMAARLAKENGIAGVGFWTLGMNGQSDATMVAAIEGKVQVPKRLRTGPSSTSASPALAEVAPLQSSSIALPAQSTTTTGASPSTSTTTSTTSTTQPAAAAAPAVSSTYGGNWQGAQTRVLPDRAAQRSLDPGGDDDGLRDRRSEARLPGDGTRARRVPLRRRSGRRLRHRQDVDRRLRRRRLRLRAARRRDRAGGPRSPGGPLLLQRQLGRNPDPAAGDGAPDRPIERAGHHDRFRDGGPEPGLPRQRGGTRRVPLRRRPDVRLRHRGEDVRRLYRRGLRLHAAHSLNQGAGGGRAAPTRLRCPGQPAAGGRRRTR